MKKNLKVLVAALAVTMTAGMFVGCGKQTDNTAATNDTKKATVSGSITASGSTALQPLAEQAAKKFTDANPDATINVQGGGSGTGLTQVMQGAVDIGNSDLFAEDKLKPEEAKQLVDHKVAVVGIGVIVNSKVKVDSIKKDDLIKIFTGQITNWKEVGGDDMKITIINRPLSSGTRGTFKKFALDGKDEVQGKALTEDSSGAVKKAIETTDGSIGYLASSYVNDPANLSGVKVEKLDNVEMNKDNITSGKYPVWAYEHMYTKGEAKDLTKAFIDYMGSADVKTLIEKLGYIPTADMKVSR
ncbi:phosphate ABC transporter substrate-binding protein [Candidatus Clostridium stratigraminis]|uniref:Phosphate-binding protein n=1 Tax=Candidatus Clostridium stratigraminis TaxID=3381661 RepID=A0ABW8T4P3_9CLOT